MAKGGAGGNSYANYPGSIKTAGGAGGAGGAAASPNGGAGGNGYVTGAGGGGGSGINGGAGGGYTYPKYGTYGYAGLGGSSPGANGTDGYGPAEYSSFHTSSGGGGGAAGGAGATFFSTSATKGGDGGHGGDSYSGVKYRESGGGGGAGGDGFIATGRGGSRNSSTLQGGTGGAGGLTAYSNGGGGGGGGAGADFFVSGATFTNTGTVTGGAGGAGGSDVAPASSAARRAPMPNFAEKLDIHRAAFADDSGIQAHQGPELNALVAANGGAGGAGGAGVILSSGGVVNSGTIQGGAGGVGGTPSIASSAQAGGTTGANGADGAGVIGSDLSVTNSGTIAGGGAADAIDFTGGTSSLILQAGSVLTGGLGVNGTLTVTAASGGSALSNVIHNYTGTTGGVGSVTTAGSGVLTLSGASTYTGATNVGSVLALNGSLTSAITVAAGGTLRGVGSTTSSVTAGTSPTPASTSLVAAAAVFAPGSATGVGGFKVGGALSLGSGSVFSETISGVTSYGFVNVSGVVTLGGALSLSVTSDASSAVGAVYTLIHETGSIAVRGTFSNQAEGSSVTANGYSFRISYVGGTSGHDVTLTETAAPTSSLTVPAGTTTTVSTQQTYTGKTQISGELDLASGGSVASSQQVALKASGAVFDVSGAGADGATVTIKELSGVAGSTIKLGAGVLSLTESVAATYAGAITDGGVAGGVGGGLVVNGSAALTLTGVETYTGKTQIYGELDLAGGAVLNQSKALTLKSASAVLDISGATAKEAILNLAGVAGSHIDLGANTLKINQGTSATFAGVISDGGAAGGTGGALIVKGAATLALTGANTFTDGVSLQGGTLELGAPTAAGVGHALTFAGSATLQLDAGALGGSGAARSYGTTIAGFAAGDHIDLASLTYGASATATYSGGVLVVSSGGNQVSLTLTGIPPGDTFSVANDGQGHVLVGLVGVG